MSELQVTEAAMEATETARALPLAARRMIGPGIARAIGITTAWLIAVFLQFGGILPLTGYTLGDVNGVAPALFALGAVLLGVPLTPRSSRKILSWLTALLAALMSVYLGFSVILVGAVVAYFEWDPSTPISAGVGIALAMGFGFSRLESVIAWKAAWTWRAVRTGLLCLGTLSVAAGTGLTVASELRRPLGRIMAQSPLEGLLPGFQLITASVVALAILVGTWRLARLLARQQLAGVHTELGVSEALWFLISMWLVYPWVAVLLPFVRGRAPHNLHFYQAASLSGFLGGLAFVWFFLLVDRPRTSSVSPLVLVLPQARASVVLEGLAARIARGWRAGPVTLVAHPASAGRVAGTHLRSALAFGTSRTLFPRSAGDVSDYLAALPPDYAWSALPRRECYPRGDAWDETFRRLPTSARVASLLGFASMHDFAQADEPRELVARLEHHVPRALRASSSDPASIDALEAKLAELQAASAQPLRQVAVAYETAEDAPLAEALVAQLDGRKDSAGVLIEAWAQPLPEKITPTWILGLRGDFALTIWRKGLRLISDSDATTPGNRSLARFLRSLSPQGTADDEASLFLVLERPPAQSDGDRTSTEELRERERVFAMRLALTRAFPTLLAVRVGEPFSPEDASTYGAKAHAGWIGRGTNAIHDARDVAERVLAGHKEPLAIPSAAGEVQPAGDATTRPRNLVGAFATLVAAGAIVYAIVGRDPEPTPIPPTTATGQTNPPPTGSPSAPASTPPPVPSGAGGAPAASGTAGAPAVPTATGTLTLDWGYDVETVVQGTRTPDSLNVVVGKERYSATRGVSLTIPAGDFTITSPRTEVLPKPSSGFLQPDRRRRFTVKFVSRHGRVNVKGIALERVLVNGKGEDVSNGGLRVAPGWHVITVADPARSRWSQRLLVKSAQVHTVTIPPAGPRTNYYCRSMPAREECQASLTTKGFVVGEGGCVQLRGPTGNTAFDGSILSWRVQGDATPDMVEKKMADPTKCECPGILGYPEGCPSGE